ncbi:MAG: hypothetical protein FWG61_07855 [Firmicutes bacterium]|nr:hypothetical protein [Bacillota bacterium]
MNKKVIFDRYRFTFLINETASFVLGETFDNGCASISRPHIFIINRFEQSTKAWLDSEVEIDQDGSISDPREINAIRLFCMNNLTELRVNYSRTVWNIKQEYLGPDNSAEIKQKITDTGLAIFDSSPFSVLEKIGGLEDSVRRRNYGESKGHVKDTLSSGMETIIGETVPFASYIYAAKRIYDVWRK